MSKYRISQTPLVPDRYNDEYQSMDAFINGRIKEHRTTFSYYCDRLHIERCIGEFPDLSKFPNARRVFITNCIITASLHPIPNWIQSLSIEHTEIRELPDLSSNLRRLYISSSSIERLPDHLPLDMTELILERLSNITKLPQHLPPNLSKLICISTGVPELPELPIDMYTLYCWDNQLSRLPAIPCGLRTIRCSGNPFEKMPWIHLLYYTEVESPSASQLIINKRDVDVVRRFREMYYAVRLRERFKRWLWRPREREVMEALDPVKLAEFVNNVLPDNLESALDLFFYNGK
jgi:hypothetical protein